MAGNPRVGSPEKTEEIRKPSQNVGRQASYKRPLGDLEDEQEKLSPPRKKVPPPYLASKVVRPFKTFLHTVQKNQILMGTSSSVSRSCTVKSFLKQKTPLRPTTQEKQRLENLRKKEEAEKYRKQKLEEQKRKQQEEMRRKREERFRKARERAEQMEEEKKKRLEQKLAQDEEKYEKVREEKLAEDKVKKKVAAKKLEEIEARRKQDEEARKQKALQLKEQLKEEEEQKAAEAKTASKQLNVTVDIQEIN
ncbi:inner centromere protein-like isoform X2 [Anolis carolinensis]|uniref:inner centromere protein-like isoform X2 n=1 Tax=Anolis carolinensis TaxID=28377 RepID=UPI002F2B7D70